MRSSRGLTIAMWSGPRNISTALMRAWESRPDTIVLDEPLYARYLARTGRVDHPGYAETVSRHPSDWDEVMRLVVRERPAGAAIDYQKHMAHHLFEDDPLDWVDPFENCLLLRDPQEMLTSLIDFLPMPTLADTGLPQQARLARQLERRTGSPPPAVDARDVLADPEGMLRLLCERVGVAFDEAMLSWEPGPRDSDGAWGPFWYDKVYRTRRFGPDRPKGIEVPERLAGVLEEARELYEELTPLRIGG